MDTYDHLLLQWTRQKNIMIDIPCQVKNKLLQSTGILTHEIVRGYDRKKVRVMQDNMLSVKVMFFSMLGAVSFLVGGCGGIPPEMVAEQIQGVSIKIQAVSNQSESLTEAENYLRQAKDAQLNKQWQQAYQLSQWAEMRAKVAIAIENAENVEERADKIEQLLIEQKKAVELARTSYETAESNLYLLQKERNQ